MRPYYAIVWYISSRQHFECRVTWLLHNEATKWESSQLGNNITLKHGQWWDSTQQEMALCLQFNNLTLMRFFEWQLFIACSKINTWISICLTNTHKRHLCLVISSPASKKILHRCIITSQHVAVFVKQMYRLFILTIIEDIQMYNQVWDVE